MRAEAAEALAGAEEEWLALSGEIEAARPEVSDLTMRSRRLSTKK